MNNCISSVLYIARVKGLIQDYTKLALVLESCGSDNLSMATNIPQSCLHLKYSVFLNVPSLTPSPLLSYMLVTRYQVNAINLY